MGSEEQASLSGSAADRSYALIVKQAPYLDLPKLQRSLANPASQNLFPKS
jgi:hypothetical protein